MENIYVYALYVLLAVIAGSVAGIIIGGVIGRREELREEGARIAEEERARQQAKQRQKEVYNITRDWLRYHVQAWNDVADLRTEINPDGILLQVRQHPDISCIEVLCGQGDKTNQPYVISAIVRDDCTIVIQEGWNGYTCSVDPGPNLHRTLVRYFNALSFAKR